MMARPFPQTFGSSGAGDGYCFASYKHSAPLEPEIGIASPSTNIRLLWSRVVATRDEKRRRVADPALKLAMNRVITHAPSIPERLLGIHAAALFECGVPM